MNKEIDYLGMVDLIDNNSSVTLEKLKQKFEMISLLIQLFFIIVKSETVLAPKINSVLEVL